jgi:murein DD-endopeptidase MepM/ murein hydrolase activator NlpD
MRLPLSSFFVPFVMVLLSAAIPAPHWALHYQPSRVVNGSPILFRVATPTKVESLSATWLGHDVQFSYDPVQKSWFALAGVSLETKPGTYTIHVHAEPAIGKAIDYDQGIPVQRQRYPQVQLKVPGKYTAPSEEEQREIARDKEIKDEAFKTVTPAKEWEGSFEPPVSSEISDVFGVQRVFNGVVKSYHQGLDFRASSGTPVAAVNSGTVILARPLFFEGNCVVLDHGQGLLTLYLHLSEIKVKEGEQVRKGQEIGLSGGTGRATGPHLHLAVRWQGTYLDPQTLLSLRLP